MNNPSISVVMPVFNAEKYLRQAIDSILKQTYKNFEFIIVNDGSTDKSLEIIKTYTDKRIRLINKKNTGVADSLNLGISIAKSRLIARMDADDIAYPNRLKLQYDYLRKNEKVVCVGSSADIIDMKGKYVFKNNMLEDSALIKALLPYKTPFIHPTTMYYKETAQKAGLYKNIPLIEDILFFNELSKYGQFGNIGKSLIRYRYTITSSTRRTKIINKIIKNIIDDYLATNIVNPQIITALKNAQKYITKEDKVYNYHMTLAKKYLWNVDNKILAKYHLEMAGKILKTKDHMMCKMILYIPYAINKRLYKIVK